MDLKMQSNLGHFTVIMSLKQTRHQYQMFTTSRKSPCTSFKILFYSGCLIWKLKLTVCTFANWYARGLQISGSIVNNFLPATHGMIISNDGLHTGELWQQSSDCASISMLNPLSPVECAELARMQEEGVSVQVIPLGNMSTDGIFSAYTERAQWEMEFT